MWSNPPVSGARRTSFNSTIQAVTEARTVSGTARAVRLLLTENDPQARCALALTLTQEGYEVVEAITGQETLQALDKVDAVLLDLTLPETDCVQLCRRIRAAGSVPVIILSEHTSTQEIIAGLEAGADDYMAKPVVGQELAARLRAVLRRVRPPMPERLRVGGLELLVEEGTACLDGHELHLTGTEFRLLVELALHVGHVVTREQLLRRACGYDYFSDTRLLDVHVRRLRAKVEYDADRPRLVTTVRGVGYRLSVEGVVGTQASTNVTDASLA